MTARLEKTNHESTHDAITHDEAVMPPDLLHGLADSASRPPGPVVRAANARSADRRPSGDGFAGSTPGLDDGGRLVPCTVCGAGLSQPRIDYGLNTCPRCRPASQPSPAGAAAAASSGGRP
jgi:hypothetical protein